MNAATLIVSYLEKLGVEYVFGVPGGAVEPIYNALAVSARNGGPRAVVARHETGAAFMAEGYARESGKLGVCIATSGPGATNLITGVANAFDNSIPMLVLTGAPAIPLWGQGALQESSCTGVNILDMFGPCTKFNTLISHAEQTERKLASALTSAMSPSKGPVHLSIPVDIQRAVVEQKHDPVQLAKLIGQHNEFEQDLYDLADAVYQAKNPVVLIGKECNAEAVSNIIEFCTFLDVRFVASPDALRFVDQSHRLFRGVYGFAGHKCAREIFNEDLDVIVAVGVKFGEWTSAVWNQNLLNSKLIHVDECYDNFLRTPMAGRHVRGNIEKIFYRCVTLVRTLCFKNDRQHAAFDLRSQTQEPGKVTDDSVPIKPQRLMAELATHFSDAQFIADPGNSTCWAIQYLHKKLDVLMDFAPMGWSIGTAIGKALVTKKPVVCIVGDGSYLMSGQEITVAKQEKLPVIFVILNDSALGMVKHGQRLSGSEQHAFELPFVDYASMAKAMSVHGHAIAHSSDFALIDIEELLARQGPTILDVRIDPEEVPPMNLRIETLNS